jgi:hypothetical protein
MSKLSICPGAIAEARTGKKAITKNAIITTRELMVWGTRMRALLAENPVDCRLLRVTIRQSRSTSQPAIRQNEKRLTQIHPAGGRGVQKTSKKMLLFFWRTYILGSAPLEPLGQFTRVAKMCDWFVCAAFR